MHLQQAFLSEVIVATKKFRFITEFFKYNYILKDPKDINFIYMNICIYV